MKTRPWKQTTRLRKGSPGKIQSHRKPEALKLSTQSSWDVSPWVLSPFHQTWRSFSGYKGSHENIKQTRNVWVLSLSPVCVCVSVCDTDWPRKRHSNAAESKIFLVSITSSTLEGGGQGGGTAGGSCTTICFLLSSVCEPGLQPPTAPDRRAAVLKVQHPITEKLSNCLEINHSRDKLTTSGRLLSQFSLSLGYLFASL